MPKVEVAKLLERVTEIYVEAGLDSRNARNLAGMLVDAEAAGRPTHGLIRIGPQLKQLRERGHRDGEWIIDEPGRALYDGREGLGYLAADVIAEKVISMLETVPLAMIGGRGLTHTGLIGYFARKVALTGHVSLWFANCSPLAAPWGAKRAVLGTNPVTVGFPGKPDPILTDLATTSTTYGDCRVALAEGREIEPGQALDAEGNPTTDPARVIRGGSLLTLGGHKGSALSVAVQLLSTALTGAMAVPPGWGDYGLLVIALRRGALVDEATFDRTVAELAAAIKAAEPVEPGKTPLLPGERSEANRRRAAAAGIEVSEKLYAELFGG